MMQNNSVWLMLSPISLLRRFFPLPFQKKGTENIYEWSFYNQNWYIYVGYVLWACFRGSYYFLKYWREIESPQCPFGGKLYYNVPTCKFCFAIETFYLWSYSQLEQVQTVDIQSQRTRNVIFKVFIQNRQSCTKSLIKHMVNIWITDYSNTFLITKMSRSYWKLINTWIMLRDDI